jgi:hypothetical protein
MITMLGKQQKSLYALISWAIARGMAIGIEAIVQLTLAQDRDHDR